VLQHRYSDPGFVISRCSDEETMQKFVDYTLNILAYLELVCLWQMQSAARLHCQLPDLRVLVIEIVKD